jgi:hypothetical protein
MEFMTYVAGFEAKDFMVLMYVPAFLILLFGSAIIRVAKGGGRAYPLWSLFGIVGLIWLLRDRSQRRIDVSQSQIFIAGLVVIGIGLVAYTPLVPNTTGAVNGVALFATVFAVVVVIIAFINRKR